MKNILMIAVALFLASCSTTTTSTETAEEATIAEPVTISLLSEDLNENWHTWQKDSALGWKIDEEGTLTSDGTQGDLVTNSDFENFVFEFDFKVAPQQNSGVIYKVLEGTDYDATYVSGPEFQIIDDINYPAEIKDSQKTGANYDILSPSDLTAVKPAGEWNSGVISIKDNAVKHILNGIEVVSYTYGDSTWAAGVATSKFKELPYAGPHAKGKIALQGHGGKIWFRNLKITQ